MTKYNDAHKGGRGNKIAYETKVVRIPVDFIPLIDKILEYYLSKSYTLPDLKTENNLPDTITDYDISEKINQIKKKITNGDSGYKRNSASKLIKDLLEL